MPDVLIAGGGPSGLAAAIALAERGVSVTVVDENGAKARQRGELLPQGAVAVLERLGLIEVLIKSAKIENVVSTWGQAQLQSHGTHPSMGLHGWGVDRRFLSELMLDRAANLGVAEVAARVVSSNYEDATWNIGLSGSPTVPPVSARFVIDATGRPARIARKHGATVLRDVDLVALTWQSKTRRATNMIAEATPEGWWYAVPHAAGETIGLMTSTATAKPIQRAPEAFLGKAQQQLSLVNLDGLSGAPHLMDSCNAVLDRMCGLGWLAAGDAAAAFDPVASQGLFNALSGGFFAGNAAADAVAGAIDAPHVYAALAARTAERTHSLTHLQYAALPFDTPFWRERGRLPSDSVAMTP